MIEINHTSLAQEIEQLLDEHLDLTDVSEELIPKIEQLLDNHLHSADVLEYLAQEIEQLLYRRMLSDRERRGRSIGFLA